MLSNITLGQYFPGNSFLHQMDSRTKLFGVAIFISTIFMATSSFLYGIVALFCCVLMLFSGLPFWLFWRSLKPLWIIILFTWLIHLFTMPGENFFTLGPLSATVEGARTGFFLSSRLVLLVAFSSLLTFTTSPLSLTDGIEKILMPFRKIGVPAHELAMMMTIALRFIPTLLEEADRIMKAQMARGADFSSGNIIRRARNMVPLLVPLFISAFRRADDLAVAMEARCYRGGDKRTRMKIMRFSGIDKIAFVALTGYFSVIFYFWLVMR
jgi:ABC-type cobalt transport system, permease component CbiQ and related transporters